MCVGTVHAGSMCEHKACEHKACGRKACGRKEFEPVAVHSAAADVSGLPCRMVSHAAGLRSVSSYWAC
jgi:hypothetical protein